MIQFQGDSFSPPDVVAVTRNHKTVFIHLRHIESGFEYDFRSDEEAAAAQGAFVNSLNLVTPIRR